MIQIKFVEPDTKFWKRWKADCHKATETLLAWVASGNPVYILPLYKRRRIRKEVYFNRAGPFGSKCAYCECRVTDLRDADIDHYRPVRRLTDENDNLVMITKADGRQVPHPGYYWLAYDWRNLLPSCKFCNGRTIAGGKRVGKYCRFPVAASHAISPGEEAGEEPTLLHPVRDNPEEHLTVDTKTGLVKCLTGRGRVTADVLGLNERDGLPEERRKAIDQVKALIGMILHSHDPQEQQEAVNRIGAIRAGKETFSLAARSYLTQLPLTIP